MYRRDTSAVEDDDDVRMMRERRPNPANRSELLQLMENTRQGRRSWIDKQHPTITQILQKYPRFQDIDDAVSCTMVFVMHLISVFGLLPCGRLMTNSSASCFCLLRLSSK